jgi:toxin-antitoxin system PIN domain toxin
MKLADSNVWLALAVSKHFYHGAAQAWMAAQPATGEVLFCRSTQQSFLRLLTTKSVLQAYGSPPLTNREAWGFYEGLTVDSHIGWSDEPRGIETHWQSLAKCDTASPKMWMDAYLAAFAIAGAHQLVTTDKAFAQYAGLELVMLDNP